MGEVVQWLGDNGGVIFAFTTALVAIWGSSKHISLKVVETVAEANQARSKLVLNDALSKIEDKAEDIGADVVRWHNELDYGQALLQRRSSDPLKRAKAEAMLKLLDPPKYLSDK